METVQEKQQKAFDALKSDFGYTNTMAVPRVEKVVISTGIGKISEKEKIKVIQDRLAKITGQKSSPRPAKKSIASFKTREGQIIGYQVTLRGKRMNDFLDRLFNIALPRTRDFRGIKETSVDGMGNITIGVPEHIIFPETADEELRDIFSLAITIVTTAKTREEAQAFLKHLGVPFKKAKEGKK